MFKKIEIWIVLLIILFFFIFTILYGALLRHHYKDGNRFPGLIKIAVFTAEIPYTIKNIFNFSERNIALSMSKEPNRFSEKLSGFNIHHNEKSKNLDLLLLISRTDYETKSQVVDLVDLKNFKILKTYRDVHEVINNIQSDNNEAKKDYILRGNSVIMSPYIDKNKNLIFLSNSNIIMKIDDQNNLIWFNDTFKFHHTFNVNEETNTAWTAGYKTNINNIGRISVREDYRDDTLVKIDLNDGKVLESISLTEIFIKQNLHNHLFIGRGDLYMSDPLHINDVEEIQFDSNYFKKGHLFVSLAHQNMILMIDPIEKKILWKINDGLFHQHDVDIISKNAISIFNNNRIIPDNDISFKNNEINIFNFEDMKMSSPYDEILKKNDVRTINQGLQEFTKFGILVEEQNYGRIIFFDDKDVIFEYINKGSNNKVYQLHWSRIIKDKIKIRKIRESFK